MEQIREFIKHYKLIKRNKQHCWYTNVYENITYYLRCMDFVEDNLEMLEHELETYAATCTKKDNFLKEWLLHGIKITTKYVNESHLLTKEIKPLWPIFYSNSAEPFFQDYDISYHNACQTQKDLKTMSSINRCTDSEILAIHENKNCNCMYMCSYCEEMEFAWEKKVKNTYSSRTNIFLYPKLQSEFVEKWLAANQTYSDYTWPPKKVYDEGDPYRSDGKPIIDYAEMCATIKENRKKYKSGGKTPLQCHDELSHDIQGLFNYIHPTDSDFTIFMKLWNKLDLAPVWIGYDKARCKEILDML